MKYALIIAVGYMIGVTWIASELVYENIELTYDLNVSQTALMIQKANYARLESQIAKGLCLEPLEMK